MLLDEILNGPLSATFAPMVQERNYQGISDILNTKNITVNRPILVHEFVKWAGKTGQRALIEDTAVDKTSPLRSVALSLLDFIQGSWGDKSMDLSDPEVQVMFLAWGLSGEALTTLQALGSTYTCIADSQGFQATPLDVASVLNQ